MFAAFDKHPIEAAVNSHYNFNEKIKDRNVLQIFNIYSIQLNTIIALFIQLNTRDVGRGGHWGQVPPPRNLKNLLRKIKIA
jgi:hypothetical protein